MKRVLLLAALIACDPVQGASLSSAPTNDCGAHPCNTYAPGRTKPVCNGTAGTCEIQGRPDFAFTIVVNVPTSSIVAPGATFLLPSTALYEPPTTTSGTCLPPSCLALPATVSIRGSYSPLIDASKAVYETNSPPVSDRLALPERVQFVPLAGPGVEALSVGFPVDVGFAASQLDRVSGSAFYSEPLPPGQYLRLAYPEPPYDAHFPPIIDEVTVTPLKNDDLTIGASQAGNPTGTRQLDDPSGDARRARVRRAEGLDGFRIWLADSKTGRRISVVRTLAGTDAQTRLDTIGQSQGTGTALRDNVDVVVAPPESWIATPRLQSTLIGGQGLRDLLYPSLPSPASLSGVIARKGDDGTLIGIPSQLTFDSENVVLDDGTPSPLIRYRTTVATDEAGRFATVLPPGVYDAVIEPAIGTGFGKVRKVLDVSANRAATLEPPLLTVATGQALLSDGRPLGSAQVLATPSRVQPDPTLLPRAARARTGADGRFRLDLDQGNYDIAVEPEAGTGFPRLVTVSRAIGVSTADIGILTVPVPMRIPLTIRNTSENGAPGLAIARAVVRIFAEPVGGGPAVEVASTMTDGNGKCQILLAQQPR